MNTKNWLTFAGNAVHCYPLAPYRLCNSVVLVTFGGKRFYSCLLCDLEEVVRALLEKNISASGA